MTSLVCGSALLASAAEGKGGPPLIPRPDRVVIAVEENKAFSKIIGSSKAPYINDLGRRGALFMESYAIRHPSQPNYVALFSGSTQGLTDDSCPHLYTTASLGGDLLGAGFTFAGFSEGLPGVGFAGCRAGAYARKHSPWINFADVPVSLHLPFTDWPAQFETLPTLAFVIPNLDNDMHDGSVQRGDAWLQEHLDAYIQWASTNNSLFILTWDEDDGSEQNRIVTLFLGPMVQPGRYYGRMDHYSLLRTLQDMFGLPYRGASVSATPILNVWRTPFTSLAAEVVSPRDGASFESGAPVVLTANVADPSAGVAAVQFFAGQNLLGEVEAPPWTLEWSAPPAGTHTLNVVARNDRGEVAASAPHRVVILSPADALVRAQGSYGGLFGDTNQLAPERTGAFALSIRPQGTYSGRVTLGNQRRSVSGRFNAQGHATNLVTGLASSPLTVEWDLGLFHRLGQVSGLVRAGAWAVPLAGERSSFDAKSHPAEAAGPYTVVLAGEGDGALQPGGDGCGTVTVKSAGSIRFAATLADGTRVSQSATLTESGLWPLYIPISRGVGLLAGWLQFGSEPDTDLQGTLAWVQAPIPAAGFYADGFGVWTTLIGSRFVPFASGAPLLDFEDGWITCMGGLGHPGFTNQVRLDPRLRLTNLGTNNLNFSVSRRTGLFRGRVTDPANGARLAFEGALLQRRNEGAGFYLGPIGSGRVWIGRAP